MGFGRSIGGEYRIQNKNPPQRTWCSHGQVTSERRQQPPLFLSPPALHCSPGSPNAAVSEWLQEKTSFGNAASSRCSAWNLLLSLIIIVVDEFLFLSGEMNQIPCFFQPFVIFARFSLLKFLCFKIPMTDPWCWYIHANIKGVYWWDPWHTIYSSTMDPMGLLSPNLRRMAPPCSKKCRGFRRPWAPRAGPRRWSTGSRRTTDACRIPQGAFALERDGGLEDFFWAEISWTYYESWCMLMYVDVCWCMLMYVDVICYDFLEDTYPNIFLRNAKDRSVAVEGLGDAVVKEGHNWQLLALVWGCLYFPESCYCTFTKLGAPWTNSGTVEIPRRYKFWKMLAQTSHPIVGHSWLFSSRVQTFKVESSKDVQPSGFVGCGKPQSYFLISLT